MKMNAPSELNPIDANLHGWIGKPVDRVDGLLKVTGAATYAYEYEEGGPPLFGFVVQAGIGKGRIRAIDTAAAECAPGVMLVMTHLNAPPQAPLKVDETVPQLDSDAIRHFGQPVALIVAVSYEAARDAATLVRVDYETAAGRYTLAGSLERAKEPPPLVNPPDSRVGDFEGGFAASACTVDSRYVTPHHIHMQMEPHTTLAMWEGETLTLYTSHQWLESARKQTAATLRMAPENIRIVSRYIGGGFGSKLDAGVDLILAALAARQLRRPVKIALTRQQLFHLCPHRTETIQRVRLGADRDGRLQAIAHEIWCENLEGQTFYEPAADQTRSLYAAPHRMTSHRLAELDLPPSASMRAPGEAVGLLALECAMDELAEALGMDPIELRMRNEPAADPEKQRPFSTRNLIGCLQEGARRFGWERRNPLPAQVREGRWLIGIGMAAAIRNNPLMASKADATLALRDGKPVLTVRTAMTDIGTGSYTIFTQIAAEAMGLPLDSVVVRLGDTDFPEGSGSGGSWGAGSAGSGIYDACMNLREALGHFADRAGIAGMDAGEEGRRIALRAVLDVAGPEGISAHGELNPGDMHKKYSQFSYGAHFAEVGVDIDTGEIRLRRMLGVFTAGRILNQKTARSQAIGGMVFGVGAALTEEAVIDPACGFFVNHDMAEYHVPTHADIPAIDAIYLEEVDDKANPLKSKGVGELGICGAGAAVANAVYNACGVRIREYPLTLDKVLAGWKTND
ncbi:xanthine dehydrogenase family protein molybdopterin-binding subunit [Oxalobacteraceae bacterium CAVE-383]|nr:xanthine dehydrogenase family protein molybdopterin-binding subunit [Oxalobacteraceae bacterium CAVE-383]